MNVVHRYLGKGTCYVRHRWDFADEAVGALVAACRLSPEARVADIGSGTGMLTRHLVDRFREVFAVEPNAELRGLAEDALGAYSSFRSVDGLSDATTLPSGTVRLVTVGRALHWFPPDSTRAEFRRILEPEGLVAVFGIPCRDQRLLDAIDTVCTADNGWEAAFEKRRAPDPPLHPYFGHGEVRTLSVDGSVLEGWDAFLGRISSMSAAPAADHPRRARFERALRVVFDRHATHGLLEVPNATTVTFGQLGDATTEP